MINHSFKYVQKRYSEIISYYTFLTTCLNPLQQVSPDYNFKKGISLLHISVWNQNIKKELK